MESLIKLSDLLHEVQMSQTFFFQTQIISDMLSGVLCFRGVFSKCELVVFGVLIA